MIELYFWTTPNGYKPLIFLEETGIVLAPGPFFGPAGEGYIRLSVTAPTERLREAMARLPSRL